MAVPETYTMMDITGKYTLNKALSDSDASNTILEQQGVGFLKRKAIDFAGATVYIKHQKDAEGVEHLEIEPQIPGNSAPKGESRVLTWTERTIDHPLFGHIAAKTRRVKPAELDDENLKKGWTADTVEAGVIQSHVVGEKWTAIQTWGIQEIDGKRRHARQMTFTGPKGNTIHARLVYDYVAA
ncbi:hypothetical protein MVEN_02525100 [Mycena venus]|uniref:LCCL domain-containing protein n=1 Tax=Mycena venus TaxID=2733690 RepID=A0A8H6WUP3_9AGAR|nr:hypothetical protein MVEN_02525100 [Mycena venus]